jgi:diadenosine tetraphosphate (Ap4A) HIT family hydrolase
VIARRKTDASWPKPVWGAAPPIDHDKDELEHFMQALRKKMWLA